MEFEEQPVIKIAGAPRYMVGLNGIGSSKRGQHYKSEKEFDAMLPMPKTLEGQSTTHGKVLDVLPIKASYRKRKM